MHINVRPSLPLLHAAHPLCSWSVARAPAKQRGWDCRGTKLLLHVDMLFRLGSLPTSQSRSLLVSPPGLPPPRRSSSSPFSSSTGRVEPPSDDFRTIAEARAFGIASQLAAGVEEGEAESIADILLEDVMGMTRAELRRSRDRPLSAVQQETLRGFLERRRMREPVQYIIGQWPFYNLEKLMVRRPTLIPRPETEELVEFVLQQFEDVEGEKMPRRILEVGPGSCDGQDVGIEDEYDDDGDDDDDDDDDGDDDDGYDDDGDDDD
eukprot:393188-Hanusia_phi.AAC.1